MIPFIRSLKLKQIDAFEARPSASVCAGLNGSFISTIEEDVARLSGSTSDFNGGC